MSVELAIVWLDLENARLFHLSDVKMAREMFRERDPIAMYDKIAGRIGSSTRIVIIGPGPSRIHFLARLQDKHPTVAQRVVACEVADHPSDGQIAALASRYAKLRPAS